MNTDRQADSYETHLPDIITTDKVDFPSIEKIGKAKGNGRGGKHAKKYKDMWCAFDIETSRVVGDHSVMYIWQFQLEDKTIIGRTWEDFLEFLRKLSRTAERRKQTIIVYVHNLSFEFQFLSGILDPENVFAVKPRKVLKFDWRSIEFRCSYLLTNLSLGAFTRQMGVEDQKQTGFDYGKVRYPWTPLSDDEMLYCINDVRGLVEALKKKAELNGDTLATMPLTATGYVRRDAKKVMKKYHWHQLHDQFPTMKVYRLARDAFRGGDTHASRFYAQKIVENVESWDRSSSYPEVMLNRPFPASRFWFISPEKCTFEKVMDLIKHERALLMRVCLKGVRLADPFEGCPYIPRSKCRPCVNSWIDNGRVMAADYLEIAVTDVDLLIILEQYDYEEIAFSEVAYARYKPLPEPLRELIKQYYTDKTALKGVEGQELYYAKAKELLNSLYGMSAQDPGKVDILYDQEKGFTLGDDITPEQFDKKMYNAFLSYTWAPWVTAWARLELHIGRKLCGRRFVYCDTDSVKYDADSAKEWPMPDFSAYNEKKKMLAEKSGAYADDAKGERHYMGVYEYEGSSRFRTLGAKKYCTESEGRLKLTCAGVGKKSGAEHLSKHGGIAAFDIGYVFDGAAGGVEAVYNDHADFTIEAEGHTLHVTKNLTLKPSTYTVGITGDYAAAIKHANDIIRRLRT